MMAEINATSARLDLLDVAMNAVDGSAKVHAIGAVVAELVVQHKSHERMMKKHAPPPRR